MWARIKSSTPGGSAFHPSELGLKVEEVKEPFRWSEEFGHFTDRYKGAFFGLGSGSVQPQSHDDAYDYPDELIEIGARLYRAFIEQYLGDDSITRHAGSHPRIFILRGSRS